LDLGNRGTRRLRDYAEHSEREGTDRGLKETPGAAPAGLSPKSSEALHYYVGLILLS
jgi:hypothetical protein